ncbi:MAG: type II toxin-antitoxin system death-on-curing family toxin [Aureispira sp.]
MKFIKRDAVLAFNRAVIERYGGSFFGEDNLKIGSPLDYLLDLCINNEVFGEVQYPTVPHVAALLLFKLVTSHVFNDGNKRTALLTSDYFLFLNGYQYRSALKAVTTTTNKIPRTTTAQGDFLLEQLIQEIAQSHYKITYEEVLLFMQTNTEQK